MCKRYVDYEMRVYQKENTDCFFSSRNMFILFKLIIKRYIIIIIKDRTVSYNTSHIVKFMKKNEKNMSRDIDYVVLMVHILVSLFTY